jgi:uncharacterized protein YjbI with pentapeptide repeats
MANEEHLAILRQGVGVWNTWRVENPDVRPDLMEAHLIGADLSGAILNEANLWRAVLWSADLGDADLSYADLTRANLSSAYVLSTTFTNIDLSKTQGLTVHTHVTRRAVCR